VLARNAASIRRGTVLASWLYGRTLATSGRDGLVKLWDVAFRPNGKHLAIGNRNGPTYLYEAATGKLRYALPRQMSHELKFSPDGNVLAVAYVDGSVGLWDVAGGELLHCRGTAEEVWSLDWSPAGEVLATGGLKGTITLWDPRDLTVLKELNAGEAVKCIRFSPDGSRLLAATMQEVQVWGLPPDAAK
jgi:WD40 repeat protein